MDRPQAKANLFLGPVFSKKSENIAVLSLSRSHRRLGAPGFGPPPFERRSEVILTCHRTADDSLESWELFGPPTPPGTLAHSKDSKISGFP